MGNRRLLYERDIVSAEDLSSALAALKADADSLNLPPNDIPVEARTSGDVTSLAVYIETLTDGSEQLVVML